MAAGEAVFCSSRLWSVKQSQLTTTEPATPPRRMPSPRPQTSCSSSAVGVGPVGATSFAIPSAAGRQPTAVFVAAMAAVDYHANLTVEAASGVGEAVSTQEAAAGELVALRHRPHRPHYRCHCQLLVASP